MPRYEEPPLTLKLIKEVEKYPCLYNCNLDDYSRRDINNEAWKQVAIAMNDRAHNCKKRWRNLRTVFVKKLKPGKQARKPYYLTESLKFILPFIKGASLDSQQASPNESETDDSNSQILQDEPEIDESDVTNLGYPLIEPLLNNPVEKNARTAKRIKFDIEIKKNNEEARKHFLLSLLPDVLKLSDNQMRTFRRNVIDILDKCIEKNDGDLVSEDTFLQPNYIAENNIQAENPLKLEY